MAKNKKQAVIKSGDVVEFVGASVALFDHLRATEPVECFKFGNVPAWITTGRTLLNAMRGGGVVLVIPPAGERAAGPGINVGRGAKRE